MNLSQYKERFEKRRLKSRVYSSEQGLAERIWLYFGKRLPFPRIVRMIKLKGFQAVYETFSEVEKSKAKDCLALFVWKIKNIKIVWDSL